MHQLQSAVQIERNHAKLLSILKTVIFVGDRTFLFKDTEMIPVISGETAKLFEILDLLLMINEILKSISSHHEMQLISQKPFRMN